jgi:putative NADH-flavin reductase
MKILVLGATGRAGKLFAQLATAKNHQVTAIIRNRKGVAKFIIDSLESEKYVKEVVTLFR